MEAFASEFGFRHRRVTPYWPRANGAAEAVMKKLARVVQFAKEAGISRQAALNDFLRAYRATPHSATGVAPADLMFGHSRACGLPRLEPDEDQRRAWHSTARANDEVAKSRMEADYNARMRTRQSSLKIGDRVLLRREDKRKNETRWDSTPFTVTAIHGSMVTASRSDRAITRNSSWFKPFIGTVGEPEEFAQRSQVSFEKEEEVADAPATKTADHPAPMTSVGETDTPQPQPQPQPPSKRRVGRPSKAVSFELAAERKSAIEARRQARPPTRTSKRLTSAAVFA